MQRAWTIAAVAVLTSCSNAPSSSSEPAPSVPPPAVVDPQQPEPAPALPPVCCDSFAAEIGALAGKRIRLHGTYRKLDDGLPSGDAGPAPPPRPGDEPRLDRPGRAAIVLADGTLVALELYYTPEGLREALEIKRFHGTQVMVAGTLHAQAPTVNDAKGNLVTGNVGPYVSDIASIDPIDADTNRRAEAAPKPPTLPPDTPCASDRDCVVSCTIRGECCGQACPPCAQAYNRADMPRVHAWHRSQCNWSKVKCPEPLCEPADRVAVARCANGKCTATTLPKQKK